MNTSHPFAICVEVLESPIKDILDEYPESVRGYAAVANFILKFMQCGKEGSCSSSCPVSPEEIGNLVEEIVSYFSNLLLSVFEGRRTEVRPRHKNDLLAHGAFLSELREIVFNIKSLSVCGTWLALSLMRLLYLKVSAEISKEDLYKALYDAVLLIDYASYTGRWAQSNDRHPRKLALLWVLVAERAIQFARAKNDEHRANSYLNAFRESQLMAELISWAGSQTEADDKNNRAVLTSPDALIKWLYVLEDQEVKVLDHSLSILYAKAMSKVKGTNRDVEMGEARFMNESCRKRKEPQSGCQEVRASQVRRCMSDNGVHIVDDDDMES
ncbi:EAP30/Vps36 family protein [Striga asiatica]|uniref:EAP30/Vps36 family protein n=1 Tax=Striga asiatica TaxID=4170 RepID=A0A5A7PLZ5_STRAF|nr:EAP30/Vps36 family protein [Striga asiatica]